MTSVARPRPAARSYVDLIGDCVHCGFCLPACPTYASWGDEMDSPRGRIDLMKGIADGKLALDATVVRHFDACLGCMSCVPACPSGVRYDLLIEATRARVESRYRRSPFDRAFRELIFALFPYPRRTAALAPLLFAYQRSGLQRLLRRLGVTRLFGRRLAALEALTPPLDAPTLGAAPPAHVPAEGERRGRVALVAGCVQRTFFPNVNAATVRVLAREGFDVVVPEHQGCCGALSLHAGRDAEAKRFARALLERFDDPTLDAVVVNAAGCGSTLKQYGELFAGDPALANRSAAFGAKVRDVSEFLAGVPPVAPRTRMPLRVAYHDACHLAQAQRIREEPRALLRTIPGLEVVDVPGEACCGSAGIYNLVEPAAAAEIGERKVDAVLSVAPQLLASANPGCTLQIGALLARRGVDLPAAHPIELLDRATAGRESPPAAATTAP